MKKFFVKKKKVPYWEENAFSSTLPRPRSPDSGHFHEYNNGNYTSSTVNRSNLKRKDGSLESNDSGYRGHTMDRQNYRGDSGSSFDYDRPKTIDRRHHERIERIVPENDIRVFKSNAYHPQLLERSPSSDNDSMLSRQTSGSSAYHSGHNSPSNERHWQYPPSHMGSYEPSNFSYAESIMSSPSWMSASTNSSGSSSKKDKKVNKPKIKMKNGWPTLETPENKKQEKLQKKREKEMKKKEKTLTRSNAIDRDGVPHVQMRDTPDHAYNRMHVSPSIKEEEPVGQFFFAPTVVEKSPLTPRYTPIKETTEPELYYEQPKKSPEMKKEIEPKETFFFSMDTIATSELEILEMGKRASQQDEPDGKNWILKTEVEQVSAKRPDLNKQLSNDPGYQTIEDLNNTNNLNPKAYYVQNNNNYIRDPLYAVIKKQEKNNVITDENNYVQLPMNRDSTRFSMVSQYNEHELMADFDRVIELGEESLQEEELRSIKSRSENDNDTDSAYESTNGKTSDSGGDCGGAFFFGFGTDTQLLECGSSANSPTTSTTENWSFNQTENKQDTIRKTRAQIKAPCDYNTMIIHEDAKQWSPDLSYSGEHHREKLKQMFRMSRDIDAYEVRNGEDREHILIQAVSQGDVSWTEMLIKMGANVNKAHPMNGCTPLHYAVTSESQNASEIVGILLRAGADVNATNACGEAAIHRAIIHHNLECVQRLIQTGVCNVNLVWQQGEVSPLNLAVQSGIPILVKILLSSGVSVDATSTNPIRQLLTSWRGNDCRQVEILQLLLQADASAKEQFGGNSSRLWHLLMKSSESSNENQANILQLVTSVVLMGYQPTLPELKLIASIDIQVYDWLNDYLHKPQPLKDITINSIRRSFRNNVMYGVNHLKASNAVRDDILLNHEEQCTEF